MARPIVASAFMRQCVTNLAGVIVAYSAAVVTTRTKLAPEMTMATPLLVAFRIRRTLEADESAIDSAA
jgi:hypothetical protein